MVRVVRVAVAAKEAEAAPGRVAVATAVAVDWVEALEEAVEVALVAMAQGVEEDAGTRPSCRCPAAMIESLPRWLPEKHCLARQWPRALSDWLRRSQPRRFRLLSARALRQTPQWLPHHRQATSSAPHQ